MIREGLGKIQVDRVPLAALNPEGVAQRSPLARVAVGTKELGRGIPNGAGDTRETTRVVSHCIAAGQIGGCAYLGFGTVPLAGRVGDAISNTVLTPVEGAGYGDEGPP